MYIYKKIIMNYNEKIHFSNRHKKEKLLCCYIPYLFSLKTRISPPNFPCKNKPQISRFVSKMDLDFGIVVEVKNPYYSRNTQDWFRHLGSF